MKKIVTLLIVCTLAAQSVGGVIAGAEAENEQVMSVDEIISENEKGKEIENTENSENTENTKTEETNSTESDDETADENGGEQEDSEDSGKNEETKPEEADKNEQESEPSAESGRETEDNPVLMSAPVESSFVKGGGSYTFDNESELADWTNPDGKISFDSSVDATGNGGGSVKFEYDTKTHPSLNRIKIAIPLEEFYSDIAYGECYTVSCKIKGERIKTGAKSYINILSKDNTDRYYPIARPQSAKVGIESDWQDISLTFIYNHALEDLEIMFPDGLSKQNDKANYDIYYIDDVKLEKHDTIKPYADTKGWYNGYAQDKELHMSTASADISETSTLMQPGETQQIVIYEVSDGQKGNTVGSIKRTKSNLEGYTFKSSEPAVAEVDDNGMITAVSSGFTVLTATKGSTSLQFILTVVSDKNESGNFVLDKPTNYLGRVEDFTGMRDYVYMSYYGSPEYNDQYALNKIDMDVTTPHIASFMIYDTGTTDIDSYIYYGNYNYRIFYGGVLNRWHSTSLRWYPTPKNANFVSRGRTAGWRQVNIVIDNPTEHSKSEGYMSYASYVNGELIGTGDFDCSSWSGGLYFHTGNNNIVKEAYVVKCGNDFTIQSVTPETRNDISVNQSFEFEFSNPIDTETVDGNVIISDSEQEIPATVEADGTRLKITPEYPLEKGEKYTVTLGKGLSAIPKPSAVTGKLGDDTKFSFTTENYPVSYEVEKVLSNKIKALYKNNTGEILNVYYAASLYKDKKCEVTVFTEGTLGAKESKSIVLAVGTGKISEYDGYEIAVYEKNADGSIGKLLNSPITEPLARETKTTDITPKNETKISVGYDSEKEIVEVTGYSKTKRSGLPVIVKIRKKGDDNTIDKLIRAEAVKTGKNGEVNYNFKLKDGTEKGRYTAVIEMPFEDTAYEREFNYLDLDEVKAFLKQIDNASSISAVEAADIFNVEKDPLCILDSSFTSLENKDLLFGAILENKTYADRNDNVVSYFKSIYNNALEMSIYIWGDAESCIDEIKASHANEYWNIRENNAYATFFESFTDSQRKNIVGKLKNAKCFKDVSDIFYLEVIREDISAQSSYSTVCTVLKKYDDITNIDYSTYNRLAETKQIKVAEKLQKQIASVKTIKELKSTFEAYAKSEYNSTGGNDGNGNGGHKGGSGSSYIPGTAVGNPEISNNVPDWYEENNNSSSSKIFDDLDTVAWAEESINKLYKLGAISGKGEKIFDPNASITREELCKIVAAAFKLERNDQAVAASFSDVEQGQWYTEYVELCYQNEVINGIGDNTFGVGRTVTREEIATILVRAAEAAGKSLDYYFTIFPFADEDEISDWAKKNVSILRECMIINGVGGGRFAPKDNVTRAQAAKMIAGILDFNY